MAYSVTPDPSPSVAALPPAVGETRARIIPLSAKAGFLLIGVEVFAYRYSETAKQLSITNREGAAIFPPLHGNDAHDALDQIQNLPNA